MNRRLPWILGGVFVAYLATAVATAPSSVRGFDVGEFGRLPAVMSGAVHPLDTAARVSLRRIRGTDAVPLESRSLRTFWRAPRTLNATEWLLEVLVLPEADTRRIFPVRDATLVGKLGLPAGQGYYTFAQLGRKVLDISKEATRIEALQPGARAPWEREWLAVRDSLVVYGRLRTLLRPGGFAPADAANRYDFAARLAKYQDDLKAAGVGVEARARRAEPAAGTADPNAIRAFAGPFAAVSRAGFLALVPPAQASRLGDAWQTVGSAIVDSTKNGRLRPAVVAYAKLSSAYEGGNVDGFNRDVATYRQWLRTHGFAQEVARGRSEYLYNRVQPFTRAAALYVAACALMCIPMVRRNAATRRALTWIVLLGAALHGVGLMWLMQMAGGLPPVNGYTGALALGLLVALGVVAARVLGRRVPSFIAPAVGLAAVVVAQRSPGAVIQLARDIADPSFGLAVAAALLLLALALTDEGASAPAAVPARRMGPTRAPRAA